MESLFTVDWHAMLVPSSSLLEIVLRGTATYLALFVLLRLVLKRQSGAIGIADLLVVVMIADAAQNGMAGDYKSITEGLLLVGTILFWNVALNWLGYHFAFVEKLTHPAPLPLIQDGRFLRANMRQELISHAELMSQLREQGIEDPAEVARASIEGDGSISIIRRNPDAEDQPRPNQAQRLV
jgi:uncharacterized membrane protein YcaP (DUF421 family)